MRDGSRRLPLQAGARLAAWALLLLLGACGGVAGSPAVEDASSDHGIHPATLPAASVAVAYEPVALRLVPEPSAPPAWDVAAGALPPGMALSPDGVLEGTPAEDGVFVFSLRATEGAREVCRTLALAVDRFGLYAATGLVAGEAWTGKPVVLRAVGASGPVSYRLAEGDEETTLTPEAAGGATLLPGFAPAVTVLAVDGATGAEAALSLVVRPDPTAAFRAEFGETDVWYVDLSGKAGDHAYATDLHAALAILGLRDPDRTAATGSEADDLVALYVQVEMLREIRRAYAMPGEDGTPLAISLAFADPAALSPTAAPAKRLPGRADGHSRLAFAWTEERGVFATAMVDSPRNDFHENNRGLLDERPLGVFLENLVRHVEWWYGLGTLREAPVGEEDVPALRALLYGLPDPGGRYAVLQYAAGGFARALAIVCAHEIGHGLGLEHTEDSTPESIMNGSLHVGPGMRPVFLPQDLAQLVGQGLPGVGRKAARETAPGDGSPGPRWGKPEGEPPAEPVTCRLCGH